MSNVTSLINHINVEKALKELTPLENIFFPVRQQPLRGLTGMQDKDHQAIIREDTNQILAVHGSRYKLMKNEVVFQGIDRIIRQCPDLDTNGMMIQDQVAYAGGRTIRSYVFPEHKVTIGSDDITQLRLNVINSYDGSTNLRICMGGFRIVCANGMVVGESFGDFTSRHTGVFITEEIAPRIKATLSNFLTIGDQWKLWAKTECTNEHAAQIIAKIAGGSANLEADLTLFWGEERYKMGGTMWAIYNALTYWATHYNIREANLGNKSAIVQSREARVSKMVRSPLFLEVA